VTDELDQLRAALEGRYAVERQIGQGGMATVYLARDARHDRQVAIKVLRPELAVSIGSDRFLREIKVAAHLQHPNILALYDSGEAGRYLYYVMPFVEGESLRARLDREEQLPLADAVHLACEVADALQYAHARQIIHRDIKPENILIHENHALVADFGIARALSAAGGDKLTETGMAVGTPHYMSPEQGLGGEHLDGRADQYSLACVFYEMLVGQPPFQGPNAMAILARHSMESVPSLQVVRNSIPDELEEAVMRALEKTPADRFATIREFADALCQADLGPAARRTSRSSLQSLRRSTPRGVTPAVETARPRRRRTTRFWVMSAVAVALLTASGLGAWRVWHPGRAGAAASAGGLDPHRIAVLYFQGEKSGDSLSYLADALTEGLIEELGQVQGLDVISKGGVAPFRGDSFPRDSVARALQAGTLIIGELEENAGRLRTTVRLADGGSGADFDRASFEQPAGNLLAVGDTLAQKVASLIRERLGVEIRLRAQRGRTRNADAWALVQRATRHQKEAEELAEKGDTIGLDREFRIADSMLAAAESLDPHWAEPIVGREMIAYRRSRLAADDPIKAGRWSQTGLGHAERALKLNSENSDALELRGNLRYWRWLLGLAPDPAEARALLKSAQEDLEAAVRIAPSQAGAWSTLSHLYNQSGDQVDVKLAARRAYEEDAYLSNADVILSRLFYSSYDLGQFPDAARWCGEGERRFPLDEKFVECQLWLMTGKGAEPDVPRAWRLADTLIQRTPESKREFQRLNSGMIVAAVLARAGLKDSARSVAVRSRSTPEVDPTRDIELFGAFAYTLMGDKVGALKSLKSYLAANPERRAALAEDSGWWFRTLEEDPRFKELVAVNQ
jgi:eukaryotic-like serine/threonine-protein kinase